MFFAFVLALGSYTPLFDILYRHIPGFSLFRAHSRFMFAGALFLGALSGEGFEILVKGKKLTPAAKSAAALAAVLFIGAVSLQSSLELESDFFEKLVRRVELSGETYSGSLLLADSGIREETGMFAVRRLKISALFCLFFSGAVFLRKKAFVFVYVLAGLIAAEMLVFAIGIREKFSPDDIRSHTGKIARFLEQNPGDYRISDRRFPPKAAVFSGALDVWGYDFSVSRRYYEYMNFARGKEDPFGKFRGETSFDFPGYSNLLRVMRLKYVFHERERTKEFEGILPRAYTVEKWKVIEDSEKLLKTLSKENFKAGEKVLLESEPFPGKGEVNAENADTLEFSQAPEEPLTVRGRTEGYSVLVVTDAYSRNLRAVAGAESSFGEYEIIPAFHAAAVPLKPGFHNFRVEYLPAGFTASKVVSMAAWLLYFPGVIFLYRKDKGKSPPGPAGERGNQAKGEPSKA